jgi:hypothetical protein
MTSQTVFRRIFVGIERLAARRGFCCLAVAVLALTVRLSLLPVLPKPRPLVHDEFSYLLGGQTLAMGRLANPPHPLAAFFETYHVNLHPTYASKYPPGQAAFLAIGIRFFGHPWYGVLLSVGLMCGLLTWMLQGWVSPKFALLGGFLTVPWFATTHYWMDSYWGGAVAAAGGALVLGALPRLARKPSAGPAWASAIGVGILANSRPFEGAVLTLASFAALLWWARSEGRLAKLLQRSVVVPVAAIGLLTAGWIGLYNYRVTGSASTLPYSVNNQAYPTTPLFWVLPPLPPRQHEYRDPGMRKFWAVWDAGIYTNARHMPLRVLAHFADAVDALMASSELALLLPLALASLLVGLRRVRILLAIGAVFAGGVLLEKYAFAHYLAPATGIVLLLIVFGLRLLHASKLRGKPVGFAFVAFIAGIAIISPAWALTRRALGGIPAQSSPMSFRRQVEAKLLQAPGDHVVIVHYSDTHDANEELVYNGPEIDTQKIIWAFDRGPAETPQLLRYYAGRTFWLLNPDPPGQRLEPYLASADAGAP